LRYVFPTGLLKVFLYLRMGSREPQRIWAVDWIVFLSPSVKPTVTTESNAVDDLSHCSFLGGVESFEATSRYGRKSVPSNSASDWLG
jgi:hypothetical protein